MEKDSCERPHVAMVNFNGGLTPNGADAPIVSCHHAAWARGSFETLGGQTQPSGRSRGRIAISGKALITAWSNVSNGHPVRAASSTKSVS